MQTLWGPLLRRNGTLPLRRERLPTPDGDFVDLDWVDRPPGSPLVLLRHGLEGSSGSHYIVGLLHECVPPASLPDLEALGSKWLAAEVTDGGGHVGFIAGPPWRPSFWAEARAIEFLEDALDGGV